MTPPLLAIYYKRKLNLSSEETSRLGMKINSWNDEFDAQDINDDNRRIEIIQERVFARLW